MSLGDVAADFGKGLFAGVAGTAAMTVSSYPGDEAERPSRQPDPR